MTDREKVIKGLECCGRTEADLWDEVFCSQCPYNTTEKGCAHRLMADALALIWEQNEIDVTIEPCKSCQEWECDGCDWLMRMKGR